MLEAAAAVFGESMRCYPLSRPLAAEIITHGRIFQGKDDPHSFTRVERWTSLEAVLANTKLAYMTEYNATKDEIFERLDVDFGHELEPPHTTL